MSDRLKAFVRLLRRRSSVYDEMDDEMGFHIAHYEEDLIKSGVSRAEAARRARREFGNLGRMKEECRNAGGFSMFDEFIRNVSFAIRQLRRSPGFTLSAVLTLGLCIGANTAVFSVINAALLRPLPYPEPDHLFTVVRDMRRGAESMITTGQDGFAWEALKDAKSFDVAAIGGTSGVNLDITSGGALYVQQQRVTAGYFRVLGVPPDRGREFDKNEDRAGGPAAVVLSYGIWQRLFHGDPSMVGRTILLRGEACTVVGIAGASFRPQAPVDVWTPLMPSTTGEGEGLNYDIIARLRSGATWAQAVTEVSTLGAAAFERRNIPRAVTAHMVLAPFDRDNQTALRNRLLLLFAAVAIVLLIGCVNIASLKLARASARRREMGTRIALGGGTASLLRQLITESLVLGVAGGTLGLALGYIAIDALRTVVVRYGIWQELTLDGRVLLATLLLSVFVSVLFGVAPALQGTRVDIRDALLEGGSLGVGGPRSYWVRRGLVLAEVALSLVLLVGAGLLIRTLLYLQHLNPGFDGNNVVTASASLQDERYGDKENILRLFRDSLDTIRRSPGVDVAAVGLHVPYQRWLNGEAKVRGNTAAPEVTGGTSLNYVTPGYFDALRIPVQAGRVFDEQDTEGSMQVAVVNATFVRVFLKGQDPLAGALIDGKRRIVGVVGDIQQQPGLSRSKPIMTEPEMYIPASQFPGELFQLAHSFYSPNWVVRAKGRRGEIAHNIETAIAGVDPLLPLASVHSMTDERDSALQSERINAWLLGVLAALALSLALVGVYGISANAVAERTREFGVRMALGSSSARLMWDAVAPGMILAAVGVAIGGMLAAGSVGVLKGLLYGVRPFDLSTFLTMAGMLIGVSAAASLLAALGVARLTPATVLRQA